jgi:glycosyltransferase involved in cell wall biosynthesis
MNPSFKSSISSKKITVSAIISTYKSVEFIRGCLEDLVTQTLYEKGELEIIVIDSASPENEQEIVEEFQQKYANIIYQRTAARETLYRAWNRAIKLARGRYITNANTDDRRCFNALEVMANYLDNNSDTSLVYADQLITTIKNDTFATTSALKHWYWPPYSYQQMRQGCCVGSQPMWRRIIHDKYGYFGEDFRCAGDYEFWLRIASQGEKMALIPEILGLYYLNLQGLEHGSNGQALQEHYQVCQTYGIPHPEVSDSEVQPNPVNEESLGISLTEDEQEKLKIIQAISASKIPIIVIDGVIFQINQGEIIKIWHSLLQQWSDSELGQYLVILDRNNTAPRWTNLKYWATEPYDYNCTGKDARNLQTICDRLQANLFISTFYTTPLSTPSLLLLASELGTENFNSPVYLEKHYAILSASRYITFSTRIAEDLKQLYSQIEAEQIAIIEVFPNSDHKQITEVNQKISQEITDLIWSALSETKKLGQNQIWLELRKLQEAQQLISLKQKQDDLELKALINSLEELQKKNSELWQNNQELHRQINYFSSHQGILKTLLKTPILFLSKIKKKS